MRLRIFCQDRVKMLQWGQMSKNVSFVLNTGLDGGAAVIQSMARPAVEKAAEKIAERATNISGAMRNHPQEFKVTEVSIGIKNRRGGVRVYAKVEGTHENTSENQYILDKNALHLALDAGRVTRLSG